jgi:hypothetical protein
MAKAKLASKPGVVTIADDPESSRELVVACSRLLALNSQIVAFGDGLGRYYRIATFTGISRDAARAVLVEEMTKARQNDRTGIDALANAESRLIARGNIRLIVNNEA